MSIWEGVRSHHRLFGPYGVWQVAKARLLSSSSQVAVATEGIRHPVYLRLRTTDVSVFEEIIINSEYSIGPSRPPRTIVDAGANIGLTSVFFANKFPHATIVAVEPERSNFEMLKTNVAPYSNIVPFHSALWKEDTLLTLSDPGMGHWGYQTREKRHGDTADRGVPGTTVEGLMKRHGWEFIDILKIDIEGAEKEVFEASAAWIDRVGIIIVELHDRSKEGCSRSVYAATPDFTIRWSRGETTFLARPEYVADGGPAGPNAPATDQTRGWWRKSRSRILSVSSRSR
jgi:FkbM family methyltransferase